MKTIALMTVAGLAAAASAQSISVNFSADKTQALAGETITWTVSVSHNYTDATAYFGGFVGDWNASDSSLGTAGGFTSFMGGNATTPVANGASVTGLNIFNSALLGTNNNANPIDIFTFEVVAGAGVGDLSYGAAGTWSMFPNSGIFTLPTTFTAPALTSDSVAINVPAPGALALVGLGGLAAARRRR
jgi:hypothetical protein